MPPASPAAAGELERLPSGLGELAVSLSRLPLPEGVSAPEVADPHALLRTRLGRERGLRTLHLGVSSAAVAPLAAALSASGLVVAQHEQAALEIDLWLQRSAPGGGSGTALLFSRRLVRMHRGVAWPHITVAALHPSRAGERVPLAGRSTRPPASAG